MHNAFTRSLLVGLLALISLLFLLSAYSLKDTVDHDYKRILLKNTGIYMQHSDLVQTSKKNWVFFLCDYSSKTFSRSVKEYNLSTRDKVSVPKNYLTNLKAGFETMGDLPGLDAAGYGGYIATAPRPSAGAAGLVVVATYTSNLKTKLIVKGCEFDAKGKKVGNFFPLAEIPAPAGTRYEDVTLYSRTGTDTIGIAIGQSISDKNFPRRVHFLEVDFNANVVRGPTQMKLLTDGSMRRVYVGPPFFNGKTWWIPVSTDRLVAANFWVKTVGHDIGIINAVPKDKSYTSKTKKVAEFAQQANYVEGTAAFAGFHFFKYQKQKSGKVDPAAKPKYYLFYQTRNYDADGDLVFKPEYFFTEVKRGKPKGKIIEVKIPAWEPEIGTAPAIESYSVEINSKIGVTPDGLFCLAIQRQFWSYTTPPGAAGLIRPSAPKGQAFEDLFAVFDRSGKVFDPVHIVKGGDDEMRVSTWTEWKIIPSHRLSNASPAGDGCYFQMWSWAVSQQGEHCSASIHVARTDVEFQHGSCPHK